MPLAIITGAGSGIGRAVAVELAGRGWDIVLAGRRAEGLEETARLAGRGLPVPTDVSNAASVAALFAAAKAEYGRIDMLFNNAGTNTPAVPFETLTPEALSEVIAVNLTGPLLCAREAVAAMKVQSRQGGRIINNGSVSAYGPRPHSVAYTASKHGITGLTKSLILDCRDYGISVCQVDIGNAATARTDRMSQGVPQANGTTAIEPRMDVEMLARHIAGLAELPAEVMVPFSTIMPTTMPLYGRG
ncbi:SDR family oxidoreductase [Paracoccus aestuariivivens]|uniref:SDR family NAD(P)-dependent oxidoreductase n=1 Tax=Paracoccus aestuariivivens TaxID=1820333 RepID=A0A6L6J9Q1_9RHOB|nr:SDR family oxidoreductase [Paracoccus aestuariivivens]MTH76864.1 SDR family NAD(P)-dependent oxidoreductase [Paracoccus aestuariivivens]